MSRLALFLDTYRKLDKENLALLADIYSSDIVFTDPAHSLSGINALTRYFTELYQNTDSVAFEFTNHLESEKEAFIQWNMTIKHPRLENGREILVEGASHLVFNSEDKVMVHRDYFDLGAMVYEHIPLLGIATKYIKKRLGT